MSKHDTSPSNASFMDGLPADYAEKLRAMAVPQTFKFNQYLAYEGRPVDNFYVIVNGTINLQIFAGDLGFVDLDTLSDGAIVGWSWLLPPHTWQFSACAATDTDVLVFDAADVRRECERDSDFGYAIMSRLTAVAADRLRATRHRLYDYSGVTLMNDTIRTTIANHPLFEGLAQDYLDLLAECAEEAEFDRGHFLLCTGSDADSFYLVLDGEVALEIAAGDRGPLIIDTVEDNDFIGWSWMIPPYKCCFDALATAKTRVVKFDGTALRERCNSRPDFGYELLKRMTGVITKRLSASRMRLVDYL